jgi:stage V sporulation protein D (sporulation-specific penicillin-binding protein)
VGTTILLKSVGSADNDTVTVPDLTGKYVREVAEILNAMGLKLKTSGSGVAFEQTPVPGTKVNRGDVVSVQFDSVEEDENSLEAF